MPMPSSGLLSAQEVTAPEPGAGDLILTALERYRERMEGVDDFVVVQETAGIETRAFFEKRVIDGRPVFFLDGEGADDEDHPADPYSVFPQLAERARLDGTELVDGEVCWLLHVDDLEGVDFPGVSSAQAPAFEPRRTSLYLDQERLILRRMTLSGDFSRDTTVYPVTVDAQMQDYREVDGVLYPFRTVVSTEGLGAAISDDERRQAEEALEQLKTRLEAMPESQRRMLENALGEQIQQLEAILGSGGTQLVSEVKELRVNGGRPGS